MVKIESHPKERKEKEIKIFGGGGRGFLFGQTARVFSRAPTKKKKKKEETCMIRDPDLTPDPKIMATC